MRRSLCILALITAGIMPAQTTIAGSSVEGYQGNIRNKAFENVKVLNNFVWELLNVDEHRQGTFSKEYRFSAPEACWIFIQSTAASGSGGEVRIFLKELTGEAPLITHVPGKPDVQEAMRQVSAGQHTLRIEGKGDAELSHLAVRRVPTLRYGMFDPYPRMINEFGPYDRKFLAEDVLRNVNTILDAHWDNNDLDFLKEWKAQGRKFFMHDALKYFEKGAPDAVEQCVRYWTTKQEGDTCCGVGMLHPLFDGISIDEFTQYQEPFLYDGWRAALDRINADPAFKNRTVNGWYAWIGDELTDKYAHKSMRECLNTLMAHGGMVYIERYLTEAHTATEAQKKIRDHLVGGIVSWLKYFPGSIGQIGACLGAECIPDEMFNLDPSVDFKVFLDMQFQALATDPALFGLGGIDVWGLHRADEETVRWVGKLYRHYAIEGNTRRMCDDPYLLAHIENPDFENGVKGWRLEPAEAGSMAPRKLVPYRAIQGRYGGDVGDTFLWTKRNAAKPNRFSQTIKNLRPGRCYSMKMITADYGNISRGISELKKDTVNIQLTDVEFLPGPRRNFQVNYAQTSNYADATWSAGKPPCFTYYWLVFRAKRDRAELLISDWASDTAPGGPIGQETMFNFIEIQPYAP